MRNVNYIKSKVTQIMKDFYLCSCSKFAKKEKGNNINFSKAIQMRYNYNTKYFNDHDIFTVGASNRKDKLTDCSSIIKSI